MIAQKLISFKSIRRVFFLRQTSTIRDYRNFLSTVREEKKCERMYDRTRIHTMRSNKKKRSESREAVFPCVVENVRLFSFSKKKTS